jgi:general secretion pathway protein K
MQSRHGHPRIRRKRPIPGCLSSQRGIALLVTLSVIAVLVPVTLELNRHMREATTRAAAARDQATLFQMAESGLDAAMAMLVVDKTESDTDSLAEDWADPGKTTQLASTIPFDQGQVRIRISDEKSRIQVNALVDFPAAREFSEPQQQLWDRFLRGLASNSEFYRELDTAMVVNSIKDWLDSGDEDAITGLSGAESDHYNTLDPPYPCRNGPILHVDEMAQIRGLNRSYLYGDPDTPGIADFVTPYGISTDAGNELAYDGRINLNTASLPVLTAMLPEESADLAESIFEYRGAAIEDGQVDLLADPQWYQDAPGCGALEIDPDLLTISSDLFRIESTAAMADQELTLVAVVRRIQDAESGTWKAQILQQETQ